MEFSISGGLIVALGGMFPALAVGLIGSKAMEALGKNPEASRRILPGMLLAMAFCRSNCNLFTNLSFWKLTLSLKM